MSKQLLENLSRSIFYSLTVTLGLGVCMWELDQGNWDQFYRIGIITLLVLLAELFTSWHYQRRSKQLPVIMLPEARPIMHFSHHLILPIAFYISILFFGFFYRQLHLRGVVLSIAFATYILLFSHIRALYQGKQKLFIDTNFIYDVVKLLVVFLSSVSIWHWSLEYNPLWGVILIALINLGILFMTLIRYHRYDGKGLAYICLFSIAVAVFMAIQVFAGNFPPLQLGMITTLGYYLCASVFHHLIHRDLTKELLLEYATVLGLAVLLLWTTA